MNIVALAMLISTIQSSDKIVRNISYGKSAQQTIDLYLPANRDTSSTKLMVLVHGGAWANGDKADFAPYIEKLQKLLPGYAFANVNYRLYNERENVFPTQEEDVKAAIEFLLKDHGKYGYSKDLVLLGASAGAHLALLNGYKHGYAKAIISFFGPTDLVHLYKNPGYPIIPTLLEKIAGGKYEASSPVNFVTASSPPTLLLHGEADMLVPVVQSKLLAHKLSEKGVVHKVITYSGAGHGWTGDRLNDSFTKIVSFLQSNVP